MAKAPKSIIGVDLGRYSLKSVLLQRRGKERFAVTAYGSHVPAEPAQDAQALAGQLKALFRDMGGSAKNCIVSVSSPEALIRIIEQPETPTGILRDALRLNGMALLNQDVKAFVLDCDLIPSKPAAPRAESTGTPRLKYIVGGLPRTEVTQVSAAMASANAGVSGVQLAPICAFNAFELAQPDVFEKDAFFLVDIGHTQSTMLVGMQRELILVRSIDFGGSTLLEALCGLSGDDRASVIAALDQEDEVMVEYTRVAMNTLTREIGSSIGFIEHHHEGRITRVFVSGGPAKSRVFLKLMGEELGMPCESWSAVENCEIDLPAPRRADFDREALDLNVACGAAAAALTGN
jgi:type IV pilus assembly protein PilM